MEHTHALSHRENGIPSCSSAASLPQSPQVAPTLLPPKTNGRLKRHQPSSEEWDALKPIIKRLYIDENQTFDTVSATLQIGHGYALTKRQFDGKIKSWGFRKNTGKKERRVIVQDLVRANIDGTIHIGSVQVNQAKLERWRKDKSVMNGLHESFSRADKEIDSSEMCHVRAEKAPSTLEMDMLHRSGEALSVLENALSLALKSEDPGRHPFSLWDAADITGSPTSFRLIEALKIESEIPHLSLESPPQVEVRDCISSADLRELHNSQPVIERAKNTPPMNAFELKSLACSSLSSRKRKSRSSFAESYFRKWLLTAIENSADPLRELWPFPTSSNDEEDSRTPAYKVTIEGKSPMSLELRRIESEKRLWKLKQTLQPHSTGLLAEMAHLAGIYRRQGKFDSAERLYHRVALAREQTLGCDHYDTLRASLAVIDLTVALRKYSQAKKLHHDIHSKILLLVGPDDSLGISSMRLAAGIESCLGNRHEAEKLYRQVLQIRLNRYGLHHNLTLSTLSNLAEMLMLQNQFIQSEQLLRTVIQVHTGLKEGSTGRYDRYMSTLASVLDEQGKYEESTTLLEEAVKFSQESFGTDHRYTLRSFWSQTRSLRFQGRLREAEALIKPKIVRLIKVMGEEHPEILRVKHELARILIGRGCFKEATTYCEEHFRTGAESYGVQHKYTTALRHMLVTCYKKQGLYMNQSSLERRLGGLLQWGTEVLAENEETTKSVGHITLSERSEDEEFKAQKKARLTCEGEMDR